MKKSVCRWWMGIGCAFVAATMGGSHARGSTLAPTEPRLWRAHGGHALMATFMGLSEGSVALKDADGIIRNIPASLLLPEDQSLAQAFAALTSAGALYGVKPGGGNRLSVFTDGPGKGLFALHTNDHYVVRITDMATISIQCLEDGKAVGRPIEIRLGHVYTDRRTRTPRQREIRSFNEAYAPVLQPDAVTFEGVLADNVRFSSSVAFEDNAIHTWGWVEDPAGIAAPTEYSPYFLFPPSHSFRPEVPVVEQKAILEPFWLSVNPSRGRMLTLPYGEIAREHNKVPMRSVEINGPVFGSRKVSVTLGPSRAGELFLLFGAYNPPHRGFRVRLEKRDAALRNPDCRITLRIN